MSNSQLHPHLCYCQNGTHESYDYLINALKIKDQIIIKYKEQNEENENKFKKLIIENSKLKERNSNNNYFDSFGMNLYFGKLHYYLLHFHIRH